MVKFDIQREFTIEELRDSVAGKTSFIPRTMAIKILSASEVPNKHEDFELILKNKNEPTTIRYLAASSLGRIGSQFAKEILTTSIQSEVDEQVLAAIVTALGRIGDERSLAEILQSRELMTGFVASQAEFAASLISYRLGLDGNDLAFPDEQDFLAIPTDAIQMQISEATDEEIKVCKLSLVGEPFGIELVERPAFQIKYDLAVGMVLFNREVVSEQGVQMLLERKALLGVFADKSEEFDTYSVSYLIFSSPNKPSKDINLLVTRPDGSIVCGGVARMIEPKNFEFSIRAVSQLGMFAMIIEGIVNDKNLDIKTARFSTSIQNSNQPLESLQ